MPNPSVAEDNSVSFPFRLSCMVSAMFFAAPSELLKASSYPEILPIPSFRTRFRPDNAVLLNVALRAADLSADSIPPRAPSMSVIMSVRSRNFPVESATWTEVSPIWIAPSFIFWVIWVIMDPNAVPASDPLSPWFAIPSRSEVTVSMSCPPVWRIAAQFPYASPSCCAVVLLFACANASISAIFALSDACIPKAER